MASERWYISEYDIGLINTMLWAFLTGGDVTLYYSHSSHFQPSVSLRHILNTHSRAFRMYIKMLSDTAERTVTKLETQDFLTSLWRNPFFFFFFFICCCSFAQLCLTLCDPSTLGFLVLHCLSELAQTHVRWVGDAIQPSYSLLPPSPHDHHPFQHQGLFQWVGSLHQVAKILELQLQHQTFQCWFPLGWTDFFFFI